MARFEGIAEVSFLDGITINDLKEKAVDAYTAEAGAAPPDRDKAILYAAAQIVFQCAEIGNRKAKQNLLNYSTGDHLDNLGLGKADRDSGDYAVVIIRFMLAAARSTTVAIPAGTRVTSQAQTVFFATNEYAEITSGAMYADILCKATTAGTAGNNFAAGDLNLLVDPIAYINGVSNLEAPTGGADAETDDDYAKKIYMARYLYSTAGSEAAYKYYAKEYSSLIDDVKVENPEDAEIVIYILMSDREQAADAFVQGLQEYLSDPVIKPLTDSITVRNIERVEYEINVSYRIYNADISHLTDIQTAVAQAAENYKIWQSAKIGRDIKYQKLEAFLINAGAAEVEITAPTDTTVTESQIAHCTATNVTYAGTVED